MKLGSQPREPVLAPGSWRASVPRQAPCADGARLRRRLARDLGPQSFRAADSAGRVLQGLRRGGAEIHAPAVHGHRQEVQSAGARVRP